MRALRIEDLIWDSWNREHITKHDVSLSEVEQALGDSGKKVLKTYASRLLVLAAVEKRFLTIVLAPKSGRKFYVVTARDMSRKERRFYRGDK